MTKTPLDRELESVLTRLRSGHDILPFMDRLLPSSRVRLAPLPDDMLEQLRVSPDFQSIRPGEPVWIAVAGPNDANLEIVLYRAEATGRHFIISPVRD